MASGLIPLEASEPFTGFVCYFGKEASNTANSWSHTINGYIRDYLSYSSEIYTVLKNFSATVTIYGKGSYKSGSGGSGRRIDYSFIKKSGSSSTTITSGTVSATGTGTNSASVSFKEGDTFQLSLSFNGTVGNGSAGMQCGFIMTIS
jgi:hypothetical protein